MQRFVTVFYADIIKLYNQINKQPVFSNAQSISIKALRGGTAASIGEYVVVGFQYYDGMMSEVYEQIQVGTEIAMVREYDNKHDPLAIRVLTKNKDMLGYIPKSKNKVLARLIDQDLPLYALVSQVDKCSDLSDRLKIMIWMGKSKNDLQGVTACCEDKMLKFTLDCGKTVKLDSFHYARTYLSLLCGLPDEEYNETLISKAKTEMMPLWGKRKIHIIPPIINKSAEHPMLPLTQFFAWLSCDEPILKQNAGSELVVIWFRDDFTDKEPLERIIHEGIRSVPWDNVAEDFEAY